MNYGYVFFGIIFTVTGIMLACEKLQITNRSSQSKTISLNAGEIIMLNGLIILIKGILFNSSANWLFIAVISWVLIVIFDIFFLSKNNKLFK